MGRLASPIKPNDQFPTVDDDKLRLTLMGMSDKWDEKARRIIHKTYNDTQLALLYKAIRNSGIYDHGSDNKVRRKIAEFPNGYVFDFIDTVMKELYGDDWMTQNRPWQHELIRPWLVVSKF